MTLKTYGAHPSCASTRWSSWAWKTTSPSRRRCRRLLPLPSSPPEGRRRSTSAAGAAAAVAAAAKLAAVGAAIATAVAAAAPLADLGGRWSCDAACRSDLPADQNREFWSNTFAATVGGAVPGQRREQPRSCCHASREPCRRCRHCSAPVQASAEIDNPFNLLRPPPPPSPPAACARTSVARACSGASD